MVAPMIYSRKFNSEELARKDPFDLNSIGMLSDCDKIEYYAGIVSCFIDKIIRSVPRFLRLENQACGDFAVGWYYFDNPHEFDAKSYLSIGNSERFKKGDSVFETKRSDLDLRVKTLFELLTEIQSHDYQDIQVPPKINPNDVACNIVSDISSFCYVTPKDSKPYFVFDFYHPKERKSIARRLEEI